MASCTDIIIKQEYRSCLVKGKKALFHKWLTKYDLIYKSEYAKGLVEFENGYVGEFKSEDIQFCDNKIKEIYFENKKRRNIYETRQKNNTSNKL